MKPRIPSGLHRSQWGISWPPAGGDLAGLQDLRGLWEGNLLPSQPGSPVPGFSPVGTGRGGL